MYDMGACCLGVSPNQKSNSHNREEALPGSHYSVAGTVQSCLSLWRPAVAQAKIAVQSPQHLRYGPRQLEWSLGVSYDTKDQVLQGDITTKSSDPYDVEQLHL